MQVERFGIIGEQYLVRKDGTPIPVNITLEPGQFRSSGRIYRVIDASNQELGFMTTFVNWDTDQPNSAWVEIEELHNHTVKSGQQKVKDIGKILVRYAIMQSHLLNHQGRVQTTSAGKSHFFYWSIGMRPVKNRVFACQEAGEIYNKMLNNIPLLDIEETVLSTLKHYAKQETGKNEAELSIDEICFIDLSKRMKRQYDKALAKNERARYGEGSLIMHMPAENLPQLETAYRNSLYTAFKVLVQKNATGI